jgi:hypothetical protein
MSWPFRWPFFQATAGMLMAWKKGEPRLIEGDELPVVIQSNGAGAITHLIK